MDYLKLVASLAQECVRNAPVIVLGSGASAAHGIPGMKLLGEKLVASTPPRGAQDRDLTSW